MKRKLLSILIILMNLVSTIANCQNNQSDSLYIGEVNPSTEINRGYSSKSIIDFENGYMLLLGEEKVEKKTNEGTSYFTKGEAFSILDCNNKKFGKISIISSFISPSLSDHSAILSYRFNNFNIKMFKLNALMTNGSIFLFVNYVENKMYTIETKSRENSTYWHKSKVYNETGNFYLTKSLELVVEMVEQSKSDEDNKKKIYVVYDKNNNIVKTETKIKDFILYDCLYRNHNVAPNSPKRKLRYKDLNESCAFSPNEVCAYARAPKTDYSNGKYFTIDKDENINTAYIDFFRLNNEPTIIYTYKFIFEKGRVENALVSMDLKYILINDKYIYRLPSIKISK